MQVTVELPEDIAQRADPGREALEALAMEGYRSGALTHYQASQLIQRKIHDHAYSIEDLHDDLVALEELRAQGLLGE